MKPIIFCSIMGREALLCGADVIDISGGVETDGFKDAAKIHDIIEIIRKEQK